MLTIRPEQPNDYQVIYQVNKKAFNSENEAQLVNKLRKKKTFIPELSLVAIKGNQVVGHILFTTIHIKNNSNYIPVYALAPMAVLPKHQRRGVGSKLIHEGIKQCKKLGNKAIVLVGHPNYYPRFGFTPAKEKGLTLPFDAPDEAFMVYELIPHALNDVDEGLVVYPHEFAEA